MLYHYIVTEQDHTVCGYGLVRASHKDVALAHVREEIADMDWHGQLVVTISIVRGYEDKWGDVGPAHLSLVLKVLINTSTRSEQRIAG